MQKIKVDSSNYNHVRERDLLCRNNTISLTGGRICSGSPKRHTCRLASLPVWGPAEWWEPGTGGSGAAARSPSRTRRRLSSWTTTAARWRCTAGTDSSGGTSWRRRDRRAPPRPWWQLRGHTRGAENRLTSTEAQRQRRHVLTHHFTQNHCLIAREPDLANQCNQSTSCR